MNDQEHLCIKNARIVKFFADRKNLDAEQTILMFVDMMEKLSDSVNDTVNSTLVTKFLENIQSISARIENIDTNLSKYHDDILTNFSLQMTNFRKEYIQDLRLNLTSNVSDKIEPLIKEQIAILSERTASIIHDTVPKNNRELQDSVQRSISELNAGIEKDAQRLLESTINQSSLDAFVKDIETKMTQALSNTHQLINSNLSSAEQRLNTSISTVKDTTSQHLASSSSLNSSVTSLLQKMENSSIKGKLSENIMVNILHALYPTSQIDHVGQQKETGDIILSRPSKPKILVENKNWGKNVVQEEIKKFIRDIEEQSCSGIFLSQNHGIANKENYEINIHDNNVLVYVHEANNDPDKIKIAIDIVDHFKARLDDLDQDTEVDVIPKEKLDAINSEVQFLVNSKLTLIALAKDFNTKLLKQLDDIKLPTLQDYLDARYASSSGKYICEYCDFLAKGKASLSAHKRRCKHKPVDPKNVVINIK